MICLLASISLAVFEGWKLNEFCWIVWVTGFLFSLLCSLTGFFHLLFDLKHQSDFLSNYVPFSFYSKKALFLLSIVFVGFAASFLTALVYIYIFGFYGIFLSVFARMEPLNLFGENGFINSNIFVAVKYLIEKYFYIIIFSLVADLIFIFKVDPWSKIFLPFKSKEIVKIHLMTIMLPFVSLLFFIILKEKYHTPVIIVFLIIFYLTNFQSLKEKKINVPDTNSQH